MNTTLKIIQEGIKVIDEKFPFEGKIPETYRGELDVKKVFENGHINLRNRLRYDLKKEYISLIKQILQAEVERLEGKLEFQKKVLQSGYETGYTHALQDQITHLQEIIKKLNL